MLALRTRGRNLLAKVDPGGPAAARFLAAEGFYPFWMAERATDDDYLAAQRDSGRAAEIAERLEDADLLSVALDALSGCFNSFGGFQRGLEVSR